MAKLLEKRWNYKVPKDVALALRDAVDAGDLGAVKEAIAKVYESLIDILSKDFDEYDLEDLRDYAEEARDVDEDEDEIDYLLDNLYDYCDNMSIWIPVSDLEEDMHEAEVHVDVDTDEEDAEKEDEEDDFRDKKKGSKVLNEKPLEEESDWSLARPNHDRLLSIAGELQNWDTLANDLLDWMSDDDIGEFMVAYGYGDFEEEDADADDNLDEAFKGPIQSDFDIMNDMADIIQKLLDENDIRAEVNPANDYVEVYIENGDWKHDHLAAKHLIQRDLYVDHIDDEDEESDTDTYTSVHKVYFHENLNEDTIKRDGKWVNKGKEGTHGTFKTKKAADAQRKAMFANGFKESVEDDKEKEKKDIAQKVTDWLMNGGLDMILNGEAGGEEELDEDIGGAISHIGQAISELNPSKSSDNLLKGVSNLLGEEVDDDIKLPKDLPESFLRTFTDDSQKPLQEDVTVTTTVQNDGGCEAQVNNTVKVEDEAELIAPINADDDIEDLSDFM